MVGYIVDDAIARLGHRVNPMTPLRRRFPQFLPFRHEASYDLWVETCEQGLFLAPIDDTVNPFGDEPVFTIVIPMFNTAPRHLEALVDSLLAQTFGNFEVVMADASTDRRAQSCVRRACERDKRLRYHQLSSNDGISENTNRALDVACGTFVVFVDHDDTLAPQALNEVAAHVFDNPDTDIVYSDEDMITDDGTWRHSPHFKPDWSPHTLLCVNYSSHLSVIRRSLLDQSDGLDPHYDGAQDHELILRLHSMPGRRVVGHIPKVLYHWRQAPGSTAGGGGAKAYAREAGRLAIETTLRGRGVDVHVPEGPPTSPYEPIFAVAPGTALVIIRTGDAMSDVADGDAEIFDVDTSGFASVRVVDAPDASAVDSVVAQCDPDDVVAAIGCRVACGDPTWLTRLAGLAQTDDVAAVSPRVVDEDGVIVDMGKVRDGAGRSRRLFAGLGVADHTMFGATSWGRDVAELSGDVVVALAGRLGRPASDGRRLVVWPPVTVTVVEPASGRPEALNPNLIGLSNGRIAMHVNAR
ncbi:glycosyltransferase family 2 protein [Williamsia sp. M5A3_1d]